MTDRIRLRDARAADIPALEAWDRDPVVLAARGGFVDVDWAAELAMAWQSVLIAKAAGRPVGVVILLDPSRDPDRYWGDEPASVRAIDIWIGAAADRGRGLGAAMMEAALARCFEDPAVDKILIDPMAANLAAQRFYRRLGFVDVGRRRFDEDDCLVMRLDRAGWTVSRRESGSVSRTR